MSEAPPVSQWFVERYVIARRIYHLRTLKAHDGFPATDKRPAVPPQTWGEWFEWAYGMTLEAYAEIARAGNHGAQMPVEQVALCEYRVEDQEGWSLVRGAPGESYEQLAKWMRATFPQIVETRERKG